MPFIKTLSVIIVAILFSINAICQSEEEFNGPFPSWANVKTRFNAKGDGKSDDTYPLQNAINALADRSISYKSGSGAFTVLYLPAGTYCISRTLELRGKVGVTIIGEDPSRTIIKWMGYDKDTMFWANGSAFFKLSRISWDPNRKKNMEAVGIHWKEKWRKPDSRSYAALNIEVSDCYFLPGFGVGIGGGTTGGGGTGHNDSEITIRRCKFFDCNQAGIAINGYNALDYWIWDCQFTDCSIGIWVFAGNYHAYRCYFKNSKIVDLHQSNSYYTSVRWCYSENSGSFSSDAGQSCNPFKRIFQGNTVVNPKETPIIFYHLGRMTLFDNELGQSSKTPYSVNQNSWCPGFYSILSVNNKFKSSRASAVRIAPASKKMYLLNQDSLRKFSKASTQFTAAMDKLPPTVKRTYFGVPTGAGSKVIQDIINKASKLRKRAIVHFPIGDYIIDQTIVIPASSDIQLAGDGFLYATVLTPGPRLTAGKPILLIKGPSTVAIKDMQFGREGYAFKNPAIQVENADQKGARAFLDQLYSLSDTSLYMANNNYLVVQKQNSFFSDGNIIIGGRLQQQNKGTSKVVGLGGQFARLRTENNAEFIARDVWWEGSESVPLDLRGSGKITIDGAMIAPAKADSLTTVRINKFNGQVNLLNMYLQGAIEVRPDNPGLQLLAWNINFYHKMNPAGFLDNRATYKALAIGFTAQCFDQKREICKANPLSFGEYKKNISDVDSFIMNMTKSDRENVPLHYTKLSPGVSNIFLSRVAITKCPVAVSFSNNSLN